MSPVMTTISPLDTKRVWRRWVVLSVMVLVGCATGTPHVQVCSGLEAEIAAARAVAQTRSRAFGLPGEDVATVPVMVLSDPYCRRDEQSWSHRVEICWELGWRSDFLRWVIVHGLSHVALGPAMDLDRAHLHPIWLEQEWPPPRTGYAVECSPPG